MLKRPIIILLLFSMIGCISCSSATPVYKTEPTQYSAEFAIYYVDGFQIKSAKSNLPADFVIIINEWLQANKLDEEYALTSIYVNDGLSEYFDSPSKYYFIYNDSYTFYFSEDIDAFLQKDDNKQYYESFLKTLQYADSVITGIASDLINNHQSN